jgi:malate dehydrogenase (oxaloacetate-decarboxylating)(NADP+)
MSDAQNQDQKTEALRAEALQYHSTPRPGKIEVVPSKSLTTQHELALAYTPGVAVACEAIVESPDNAMLYTSRGNLVAVISNGTAVLGLGKIGALASKPVMEGKGVLFKKFGGVNVFDLEIDETDPQKLVDIIASLEPTFGGINLEDIKAPECFFVEDELKRRMKIPVFHDDQHGTAIVAAAAILNALKIVEKDIGQVRFVCSGAGAAAIACMDLLVYLGLNKENILVCDSKGVIHTGRENLDPTKQRYAAETACRTLAEAISGADVFLGVSGPGTMDVEMVRKMGAKPIILALANPEPEIRPELVRTVRDDAVIATGRSDYPNQVNNVLCFPYIFRGALDVGATAINEEMKRACAHALAALAHNNPTQLFSADYLIPSPFDTRLRSELPVAVAQAAMESGVATRPIEDIDKYRATLSLSL